MAKYIKQEVPDMLKTGQTKAYYRLKTVRNISSEKFIDEMCHPGSGLTRGEVIRVLLAASCFQRRCLVGHHLRRTRRHKSLCQEII